VGKAPHHKKAKKHPKRKLAGTPLPGGWILGGNDAADNCAAVAVANALLLTRGLRTSGTELARLHDRAGPLSIPEALAALGAAAMGSEVQPGGPAPWPVVAGLATPHGPHAALLLPGGGLVTWGGEMALPDDWEIEEAWSVSGPREVGRYPVVEQPTASQAHDLGVGELFGDALGHQCCDHAGTLTLLPAPRQVDDVVVGDVGALHQASVTSGAVTW
jgi:hypothetical protein